MGHRFFIFFPVTRRLLRNSPLSWESIIAVDFDLTASSTAYLHVNNLMVTYHTDPIGGCKIKLYARMTHIAFDEL